MILTRLSLAAFWEDVHRVFYERVPVIRYGDLFGLRATQATVKGYNEKMAFLDK